MEENTDGNRKTPPSIPANYISILQLQESWINEKERKQKEEAEERRRIEEDLKKAEVRVKQEERNQFEETSSDRSIRKHSSRKESIDGGEARSAEKDEPEVTAAIGSVRGEESTPTDDVLQVKKRRLKKRYGRKKNKIVQDVFECGSIAPPEIIVKESKNPVNDEIKLYSKKRENATGKESIKSRGKAVPDCTTAMETRFKNLSIKEGETKNLKALTSSSYRNLLNQRQPQRARTATMVWVKKEQNEKACEEATKCVKFA